MQVLVRPSVGDDVAAITAIYAHHVRCGTASFETDPPGQSEMMVRRAAILSRSMPYLVAEEGSAILGYAYAGPYRPRAAYADTVENSIYIRPDLVGRGIGRALLTALVDACEALNLRQMIAVVGDSENLPSIRLHERCGFQHAGLLRSVGWKHGRWLDSVLLQRALGRGDSIAPSSAPSGSIPSGGAPSGGAPSGSIPSGGAPSGGAPFGGVRSCAPSRT